jgi:hypothetical protein
MGGTINANESNRLYHTCVRASVLCVSKRITWSGLGEVMGHKPKQTDEG